MTESVCLIAGVALLVSIGACGGRYDDSGTQHGGSPAPSVSAQSASGGQPGSPTHLPMHQLGDCVPGFDRTTQPARPCTWVTDTNQCFDTLDAACACICPTGGSLCSSGFDPDASGASPVHCDKY
jgi:hypothetical protein